MTAAELRFFVGSRADRYLRRWRPALGGPGFPVILGFHWWAFLLPGLWPPYRKMSRATALFYAALASAIAVKRGRVAEDPELFSAYRTLAADAKSVVATHVDELIGPVAKIIGDGVEDGTLRPVAPIAAGRAVLIATTKFHHPSHAAEWADPAIDAAYDEVWRLLMNGLCPGSNAVPDRSHTGSRG